MLLDLLDHFRDDAIFIFTKTGTADFVDHIERAPNTVGFLEHIQSARSDLVVDVGDAER